ncbi:uncharacterized protein SPSK_09930 [Sporothrix schenckii 1099-18]|uniref:Uncharacterized protein n=1 Tax=Sporothrix schenckii 1099-18 TaxID=1397361 RepID=A0A0F2M7Q7_SPOSC|nr:uncharacterized protein SPSK_09930 [Sporothrix schenckii 1099-18]KJR85672.1 hypothetical protein SPSK_09930 [Sporothrix schenckii 1099-18]
MCAAVGSPGQGAGRCNGRTVGSTANSQRFHLERENKTGQLGVFTFFALVFALAKGPQEAANGNACSSPALRVDKAAEKKEQGRRRVEKELEQSVRQRSRHQVSPPPFFSPPECTRIVADARCPQEDLLRQAITTVKGQTSASFAAKNYKLRETKQTTRDTET